MVESEIAERIAARRAELDELEEQLVKQLDRVRAERDEPAVAERVWQRMAEQLAAESAAAEPPTVQLAGRAVLLVPHRGPGVAQDALPPDYQRIFAIVRDGGGQSRPSRSVRRWGWRWRCGASWSRCAGSCPGSPGGAGCVSCPTAATPHACDQVGCGHRGVTELPPAVVEIV